MLSYIKLYVLNLALFIVKLHVLLIALVSTYSYASSHINPQVINRAVNEIDRQIRLQREIEKSLLPESQPKQTIQTNPLQQSKVLEGGPCFKVRKTILIDSTGLLPIPLDYTKLNGQCADRKALVQLLESINIYYQQQGLITTRVYLKQQNLKSGELLLVAKAGILTGFNYISGKPVDRRVTSAYPFSEGDLITLRELEQGLDNLNRLQSQSAKTELQPGEQLGQSQLAIDITNAKPWRIDLGLNNYGVKTTGTRKASIGFGYDNLLNLNDDLYVSYNQNTNSSAANKRSKSLSFSYNIPYKNWLFNFSTSQYNYRRILSGINQNYDIDGFSNNRRVGADYLLFRNQQSRVYATSSLTLKKSRNFIEDTEIESQYRRITLLELGLKGDHQFQNQNFIDWSVRVVKNLKILTSMHVIPGLADDDFKYLRGGIKLDVPLAKNRYKYSTELVFQYSDDELTGSEQFSAGGLGSVRGFHTESIYGNTGMYWRNTFSTANKSFGKWQLKPEISFDLGAVKSPATITWSDPLVAGVGLGLSATYKKLSIKLNMARAIKRPNQLRGSKN